MGNDRIDASAGLALSLALFERYRKNGLLQAELHHVPGFRGRCKGVLQLVEGKVTSCYLETQRNERYPVSRDMLSGLDHDRGPFEWSLLPLPAPPSPPPGAGVPVARLPGASPVPRRIAPLNLEQLPGWTQRQKMMLSIVFEVIDGQRSIERIRADTPLPPAVVEEALRVLLALKVIVISSL